MTGWQRVACRLLGTRSWMGPRVEAWWWLERHVHGDRLHAACYRRRKAAERAWLTAHGWAGR